LGSISKEKSESVDVHEPRATTSGGVDAAAAAGAIVTATMRPLHAHVGLPGGARTVTTIPPDHQV
jgi:hypothetical protein